MCAFLGPYICSESGCGEEVESAYKLKKHLERGHGSGVGKTGGRLAFWAGRARRRELLGEAMELDRVVDPDGARRAAIPCPFCDDSIPTRLALRDHLLQSHADEIRLETLPDDETDGDEAAVAQRFLQATPARIQDIQDSLHSNPRRFLSALRHVSSGYRPRFRTEDQSYRWAFSQFGRDAALLGFGGQVLSAVLRHVVERVKSTALADSRSEEVCPPPQEPLISFPIAQRLFL